MCKRTDAIQLALRALDIGVGDIVLVPNMTFWATFEAVVNVGAIPLTVDSEKKDGGVDINSFFEAVEKKSGRVAAEGFARDRPRRNPRSAPLQSG